MTLRRSTFLCLLVSLANPVYTADDPIRETQSLTLQWTELEHQQDELRSAWRQQQPVLEQQVSLLEREQRELNTLLAESAEDKDQVEQRRLELLEQQTSLEQQQAVLERELSIAIIQVQEVAIQLPPPLRDAWQELMPKLLVEESSVSERLSVLLEMLAQQDDFQRKITLNQAVMSLSDGNSYLVNQVYLGLSHGWLVTADGNIAMSGQANINGWQWQESSEASEISRVISILQRQQAAELLTLSVKLSDEGQQ